MRSQLESEIHYGFHGLLFCAPGFLDTVPSVIRGNIGQYFPVQDGYAVLLKSGSDGQNASLSQSLNYVVASENAFGFDILWTGAGKTGAGEGDLVLPISALWNMTFEELGLM